MRITNTIEINSTPEEVFNWLKDPNKAMEWIEHHPAQSEMAKLKELCER